MQMKIALAGNPNCGKTTMFNDLTGSNQYVGNWPGVTVEKKEGKLHGRQGCHHHGPAGHLFPLPLYAGRGRQPELSASTNNRTPFINLVDGTNLERNLYLTTQLLELGIPVVIALNMMDMVKKNGDQHRYAASLPQRWAARSSRLRAVKGTGSMEAAERGRGALPRAKKASATA